MGRFARGMAKATSWDAWVQDDIRKAVEAQTAAQRQATDRASWERGWHDGQRDLVRRLLTGELTIEQARQNLGM